MLFNKKNRFVLSALGALALFSAGCGEDAVDCNTTPNDPSCPKPVLTQDATAKAALDQSDGVYALTETATVTVTLTNSTVVGTPAEPLADGTAVNVSTAADQLNLYQEGSTTPVKNLDLSVSGGEIQFYVGASEAVDNAEYLVQVSDPQISKTFRISFSATGEAPDPDDDPNDITSGDGVSAVTPTNSDVNALILYESSAGSGANAITASVGSVITIVAQATDNDIAVQGASVVLSTVEVSGENKPAGIAINPRVVATDASGRGEFAVTVGGEEGQYQLMATVTANEGGMTVEKAVATITVNVAEAVVDASGEVLGLPSSLFLRIADSEIQSTEQIDTGQSVEIVATVSSDNGFALPGQIVELSISNATTDVDRGVIVGPRATTNEFGEARFTYVAGTTIATNVELSARLIDKDLQQVAGVPVRTVRLTITDVFVPNRTNDIRQIVIAAPNVAGNQIAALSQQDIVAFATDANRGGVDSATLTVSVSSTLADPGVVDKGTIETNAQGQALFTYFAGSESGLVSLTVSGNGYSDTITLDVVGNLGQVGNVDIRPQTPGLTDIGAPTQALFDIYVDNAQGGRNDKCSRPTLALICFW